MSRARRYALTLKGVDAYQIILLSGETLAWQRQALASLRSLEDVGLLGRFEYPVAPGDLSSAITRLTGQTGAFSCWMFYEGVIGMELHGADFKLFLEHCFASASTCDLSIAFESPAAVLCVNDNEYDVTLHYLTR